MPSFFSTSIQFHSVIRYFFFFFWPNLGPLCRCRSIFIHSCFIRAWFSSFFSSFFSSIIIILISTHRPFIVDDHHHHHSGWFDLVHFSFLYISFLLLLTYNFNSMALWWRWSTFDGDDNGTTMFFSPKKNWWWWWWW